MTLYDSLRSFKILYDPPRSYKLNKPIFNGSGLRIRICVTYNQSYFRFDLLSNFNFKKKSNLIRVTIIIINFQVYFKSEITYRIVFVKMLWLRVLIKLHHDNLIHFSIGLISTIFVFSGDDHWYLQPTGLDLLYPWSPIVLGTSLSH